MRTFRVDDYEISEYRTLLMLGLSEPRDAGGRDVVFQCDLRTNDYPEVSNWPEGESYCLTDGRGRTAYGGVSTAVFQGPVLRMSFTAKTVSAMGLDEPEWEFVFDGSDAELLEVRTRLERILTCGRPEYRPGVLDLGN